MKTQWSDLPNAKYIDMILADLQANPKKWTLENTVEQGTGRLSSRSAAWESAWQGARDSAWNAARFGERDIAWRALVATNGFVARGASLALIAYDDCAYLLDEKPEHVLFLSLLGDNPAAILMYPACVALQKEMA